LEKINVFAHPKTGKELNFNPGGGGDLYTVRYIPSFSLWGTVPHAQATGKRRDLDSLLRSLAVLSPAADELPAHGLKNREFWNLFSDSKCQKCETDNDPSAGSPTETLLRLLLPLNAQVWESFQHGGGVNLQSADPNTSLKRSIGSSDGRCVQRAGT
jgi:hypothetical protein